MAAKITKQTYTATFADGTTETRTTAVAYTHVVAVYLSEGNHVSPEPRWVIWSAHKDAASATKKSNGMKYTPAAKKMVVAVQY